MTVNVCVALMLLIKNYVIFTDMFTICLDCSLNVIGVVLLTLLFYMFTLMVGFTSMGKHFRIIFHGFPCKHIGQQSLEFFTLAR